MAPTIILTRIRTNKVQEIFSTVHMVQSRTVPFRCVVERKENTDTPKNSL